MLEPDDIVYRVTDFCDREKAIKLFKERGSIGNFTSEINSADYIVKNGRVFRVEECEKDFKFSEIISKKP